MAEKSQKEIQDLASYYEKDLYVNVRAEQSEDLSYYYDNFAVPEIKSPHQPLRTGLARRIIDSPAEQMITRNPQAFIECENKESRKSLSAYLNYCIHILRRQNPNPFKESVKNPHLLGETYIYLTHDEDAITNNESVKYPISFIIPDPLTIYSSVEEDENGIPDNTIVISERQVSDIKYFYPDWTPKDGNKSKVKWLAYFDAKKIAFTFVVIGLSNPPITIWSFTFNVPS